MKNLSRSIILSMRYVSDKTFRENQNTHYVQLSHENLAFYDCVEKYCRAGQVIYSNTTRVLCMLGD
jgi:hypothetical protein